MKNKSEDISKAKEVRPGKHKKILKTGKAVLPKGQKIPKRKSLSTNHTDLILKTLRIPLVILNADMRIREANKAFYEFFQLMPSKAQGKLIYGSGYLKATPLRDQLRSFLKIKTDFREFTLSYDSPETGYRSMLVHAHRIVKGRGDLILVSFEDITSDKKSQQILLETQEQLKLALQGGSVGTWVWNIRTQEVTVSREEEEIYGLYEGAVMKNYKQWQKTLHPDDLQFTSDAVRDSIEKKIPLDIEFRIIWPDKSIRWIMAKANTYYDGAGKPERMMGVHLDVTDRRRALEALEESEKLFHTLSDQAPVLIWMAGADKKTSFVNKTWLSFTGRSLHEELGFAWLEAIHPEDKIAFLEIYNRAFDLRQEFKADYRFRRHDGEYRWVMTHGVPRFSGENHYNGFIGTCMDITDRIDLERQKDDFLSIASHEFKTPVTSIKAYAQILHEKFLKANDESSSNMLSRLDAQIDKLTYLINTLLDVAKIQGGQMDYHEEFFDLPKFIQEVSEEIQHTCPNHRIVTIVKTTGKLYADKARITQVFNNLIANAAKYSPESDKIIVQAIRRRNQFVFSVQDFGVGISKDMQEKVFTRFFRVNASSGNRTSGLGLGLFISSQIISQQNGKLWVESQPGKGSEFFFSLPVKND